MESNLPDESRDERDAALLRVVLVVYKWRRFIGWLTAMAVALALLYSVVAQRMYRSTATIITPDETRGGVLAAVASGGITETMGGLGLPAFGSLTPNRDLFLSILRSRTIAGAAVEHFGLVERYGCRYGSDALSILKDRMQVAVSKEGVISVQIEETSGEFAADMANFLVRRLDEMVTEIKISEASKQKAFISKRLEGTREELRQAEESLRKFREEHNLLSIEEQAKTTASAAQALKMEIGALEALIVAQRGFIAEGNPDYLHLQRLVSEKKRQLGEFQHGASLAGSTGEDNGGESPVTFIAFSEVPQLGLEFARLSRDVLMKGKVYGLLVEELERARISETRDFPVVQVLDTAVPAARKSRPRLVLNVVLAGAAGLLGGFFLAFLMEYALHVRESLQRLNGETSGDSELEASEAQRRHRESMIPVEDANTVALRRQDRSKKRRSHGRRQKTET